MTAPFYRFGKQGFVAKSAQILDRVLRRDSPCGCPISAKPIQSYSKAELLLIGFYLRYTP